MSSTSPQSEPQGAAQDAAPEGTPRQEAAPEGTRPAGPPAPRPRGRGNWRSLVLSLAVVLAVVAVWVALLPRPARIERPAVDVTASADYVLSSTGLRVYLPTLEAPWRPTSVRTTDDAGLPGWHAGWTTPEEDTAYIGVEQARSRDPAGDAAWINAQVKGARQTGVVDISGRPWRLLQTGDDPVRTSLVGTLDGVLVVVTGLVDAPTLTQVAASLRPYQPAGSPATNPAGSTAPTSLPSS